MAEAHAGYVDFDGRIRRFTEARAMFKSHELDMEATGLKWQLHLYGVRFPDVTDVAQLEGKQFGPDSESVFDDPIAEGGIETPTMHFSWQSLEVRCGRFDPATQLMTVTFEGEAKDHESGRIGTVSGSVRCKVVSEAEYFADDEDVENVADRPAE